MMNPELGSNIHSDIKMPYKKVPLLKRPVFVIPIIIVIMSLDYKYTGSIQLCMLHGQATSLKESLVSKTKSSERASCERTWSETRNASTSC